MQAAQDRRCSRLGRRLDEAPGGGGPAPPRGSSSPFLLLLLSSAPPLSVAAEGEKYPEGSRVWRVADAGLYRGCRLGLKLAVGPDAEGVDGTCTPGLDVWRH